MNRYQFVMKSLKDLYISDTFNMYAPEGWGIRIEGIHENPEDRIVKFTYSSLRDVFVVSNWESMFVIPSSLESFQNENPNEIFYITNGEDAVHQLEWRREVIPTALLEWLIERAAEYLYPFELHLHHKMGWIKNNRVEVLFAQPYIREYLEDGTPVYVLNMMEHEPEEDDEE